MLIKTPHVRTGSEPFFQTYEKLLEKWLATSLGGSVAMPFTLKVERCNDARVHVFL